MELEIVILAAGKGTRMRSKIPKVLHSIAGKPLLAHVIKTANSLDPKKIIIIYGHGGEKVKQTIASSISPDINKKIPWQFQYL